MSIRLFGLAKTEAALRRVQLEAEAAAPTASNAGAEVVARQIAARAPRNTGATAASVSVDSDGETAHAGPRTSYARFPEFGTIYISGQHYMEAAADASIPGIIAAEIAVFKAAVEG